MAAYAALCSVLHIIDQTKHHPRPPISLDENQAQTLIEKVAFLQDFLELYSHARDEEADRLQSRIAEAAYAVEDVIESHIVDQIRAQATTHDQDRISYSADFYQGLQKVIGDMDLITKQVTEMKEKMGSAGDIPLHRSGFVPMAGSSGSPSKGQNIMVGFDDVLIQLMDKLTGQQSNCQIIPIVGMGGIGKTTLARNVYENPLILRHFDVCAWVTISQEYSVKEILLEVVSCLSGQKRKEKLKKGREEILGHFLYQNLYDRRYLIIMDDMWSIEAWNKVKVSLPDNNNGSRVIITTRLSNIALHFPSAFRIEINFLGEELSWNLLCKIVFGADTGCPLELEDIGRKIAKNCKGLPLSIVVIGGILAKLELTREHWEDIAENLNSIVNLEDDERCFNLLYMSYNHLPVHLKPCFLYMGVFPEDSEIRVSNLIKKWVAEGFLKPIIGKSLEEIAEKYLNDLIDRNLILIFKWKFNGKIKLCKIHDLVRDLCLREVQKENFLCVTERHSFSKFSQMQGINAKRRIAIHRNKLKEENRLEIDDAPHSPSFTRSLICESPVDLSSFNFRLLRLLEAYINEQSLEYTLFHGVNLWYFVDPNRYGVIIDGPRVLSSFHLLWNLQMLVSRSIWPDIEIWKMPLLRHVELHQFFLRDPFDDFSSYCLEQNEFVLENLQTLSNVVNFRCSEKMVKIIPNIKKLRIYYQEEFKGSSHYCLNNFACLHKLESLSLYLENLKEPSRRDLMQNLIFPPSLKKLTLEGSKLHWEDISTKIGSLPHLQVLKLRKNSFIGPKLDTVEGQFLSLKVLLIEECYELEDWTTDNTHFPRLEHLVLTWLMKLKEIPLSIGEIPTLESIELNHCSNSAIFSAEEIANEQEQLGNESLRVQVMRWWSEYTL